MKFLLVFIFYSFSTLLQAELNDYQQLKAAENALLLLQTTLAVKHQHPLTEMELLNYSKILRKNSTLGATIIYNKSQSDVQKELCSLWYKKIDVFFVILLRVSNTLTTHCLKKIY